MTNSYCPSCRQMVDMDRVSSCPQCAFSFSKTCNSSSHSIVKEVRRPKSMADIELAVTVDMTESCLEFQQGIPMTLEIIFQQLTPKAQRIRSWLQLHGDLEDGHQHHLIAEDCSPEQILEDVKQVIYEGQSDPHETHLDAIENLLKTVPWSGDPGKSRGAIIGYMTAESKPLRSGRTPRELGEDIKQQGILLYLVCQPTPNLWELVESAGGMMFEISNAPRPEELQQIASQLAASIVATVGMRGKTVPMGLV